MTKIQIWINGNKNSKEARESGYCVFSSDILVSLGSLLQSEVQLFYIRKELKHRLCMYFIAHIIDKNNVIIIRLITIVTKPTNQVTKLKPFYSRVPLQFVNLIKKMSGYPQP